MGTGFLRTGIALAGAVVAGAIGAGVAASPTSARPPSRSGYVASDAPSGGGHCAGLAGTRVESGLVENAEAFTTGESLVGGETAGAKAAADICRVRLRLHPAPGSDIRVEVWLPQDWNRKLFAIGGAGFDGGLNPGTAALLGKLTKEGYAAVATDVGHKAGAKPESWLHDQPEKLVDFGNRGEHLAAVVAKQVIAAYYGGEPRHAYFFGCSNGGRDGLMEASRYPDDYDGVIAGDPAQRYIEVLTEMIWNYRAVYGPGGAPDLKSKLGLIHAAVMKRCDALDGVRDGILENPRLCRFDPAVLQCKGADRPTCLTAAEVAAVRKIYAGPRLADGQSIVRGPEVGGELTKDGWPGWITTPLTAMYGQEFYRWFVYDDPNWKIGSFDFDRDYPAARARLASIIDPDNGDLRAFARRGGKLIIYEGWSDPGITPGATLRYYDEARRRLGSSAGEHVRLFMVPSMYHCAGGAGATSFDMQPALEAWVEHDEAPERVIAVKPGARTPFSHPLCAWPMTAHYKGSGSPRDAANFSCKAS